MKFQQPLILRIVLLAVVFIIGCSLGVVFVTSAVFVTPNTQGTVAVLSFSQPGTVAFLVPLNVPLAAGTIIAQLENTGALTAKALADTNLAVEQGKMAELEAVVSEEGAFATNEHSSALTEASSTLAHAEAVLVKTALSSASSTMTALAQTDILFSSSTSATPESILPVDPLTAAALVSGWQSAHGSAANASADTLVISANPLATTAVTSESADIAEVQLFLEDLGVATSNNATTTGLTTVDTALNALLSAEEFVAQDRVTFTALFAGAPTGATAASTSMAISGIDIFGRNLATEEKQEALAIASTTTALATASTTLSETYIYAPAAGEIIRRDVSVGGAVTAGQGILLFSDLR